VDHIVENRCPVPVPVDWSRLDDSSQTPIEMDAKKRPFAVQWMFDGWGKQWFEIP